MNVCLFIGLTEYKYSLMLLMGEKDEGGLFFILLLFIKKALLLSTYLLLLLLLSFLLLLSLFFSHVHSDRQKREVAKTRTNHQFFQRKHVLLHI